MTTTEIRFEPAGLRTAQFKEEHFESGQKAPEPLGYYSSKDALGQRGPFFPPETLTHSGAAGASSRGIGDIFALMPRKPLKMLRARLYEPRRAAGWN